jgi:hypothetical protein
MDEIKKLNETAKASLELLQKTLKLLHDIGGNYYARRALRQTNLTVPLRSSMRAKALTDEQIEKLCLDTWEEVVTELNRMAKE